MDLIRKLRMARAWRTIRNTMVVVGTISMIAAVVLVLGNSNKQSVAIEELSTSLATTCAQTNTASLPSTVKVDCSTAQSGGVPEVVQGIVGETGPRGETGAAGAAGKDGSTPACMNTPTQCQGTPGKNGANGKDGSPAISITMNGQTCPRTGGTDTAPSYTCPSTSAATPSTTADPGP